MRTLTQIMIADHCTFKKAVEIQEAERKSELPASNGSGTDYHPVFDGPAEPVGLCMTANGNVAHFVEWVEGTQWRCRRCGKLLEIYDPNDAITRSPND